MRYYQSSTSTISFLLFLYCFTCYCETHAFTEVAPKTCRRVQSFASKHNKTIDSLLMQGYLKEIPFKKEEMVPPFITYVENYLVEPKYNLLSCTIPKVLSTIRVGLFWLLHNQTSYDQSNYTLSLGDWDQLSAHLDGRYNLGKAQGLLLAGYTKFMIHRDPLERFVSGYIDKCINSHYCFRCKQNVSCYIEEQYKRFMLYGNGFRLDRDHGMEDFHFAPQTWYCRLNQTFYDYKKIRYEGGDKLKVMVDNVIQVLRDACVEERLLKRIRSEMMEGRTGHTTRGTVSRSKFEDEIRHNPRAAGLLMKMYYYDYIAFEYPLPAAV